MDTPFQRLANRAHLQGVARGAQVADDLGITVRVYGTPAEEGGGGKILMAEQGMLPAEKKAARWGSLKLVRELEMGRDVYFDLKTDPGERRPLDSISNAPDLGAAVAGLNWREPISGTRRT